jgi:uncharacterized protein YbjT (DUF2867 family)
MTDATRSALLLGATGLVGGHCLQELLADSTWDRVTVLGRRNVPVTHPKLEQRVVDFDRLRDAAAAFAVDDVFCCLGTTIKQAGSQEAFRRVDHDYVVAAARLASEGGARRFLHVTALGADAGSRVFYNRVKGETENAIAALPFSTVVIARPSLLMGDRAQSRPLETLGRRLAPVLSLFLIGPLRTYRPIAALAVARALVRLAKEEQEGVRTVESAELAALGG